MIVVGQASAAATSVAIPAHQPGDLILVFTRRASNTTVTKPTASGSVPNWVDIQAGAGANTLALRGGGYVAHRSDHTTGVWGSAAHIVVLVLRPDAGKILSLGPSAVGSGNNTQTIIYPALTLADADGSSWVVRCGTRTVAVTAVGTAPTNYTQQAVQPAGASALMSVHTRAGVTGNPTADTVSTTGTNSAYRAITAEIREDAAPVPTVETLYDDFNRADGPVYAGEGAARWEQKRLDYDDITGARVVSNALGLTAATWHQAVSLYDTAGDFDFVFDVGAGIGPPNNEMAIWFSVTSGAGASPVGYTLVGDAAGFAAFRRYLGGVNQGNFASSAGLPILAAGDSVWISRRNPLISYYHRRGSGPWVLVLQGSDTNIVVGGRIALEMSDTQVRYDNVRGGPFPSMPLGPVLDTGDTVTVTDNLSLTISPLPVQTGLAIWLDADDDATFAYSSGVQVSQWSDKSGGGYHFAHGNPVVQPSRNTLRNGKKTLNFDGGRVLEQAATAPFQNNDATIFAVLCETGVHRDFAGFMAARVPGPGNDYDAANGFDLNDGNAGANQQFLCDRASGGAVIAGAAPAPFAVYTVVMQPTTMPIYKDGVAGTPGGTASGGAIPGIIIGCRWLGGAADYANYGMRGEWAEFIAYNRVLTAPEIAQVQQYLKEKWLLPVVTADTVTVSDSLTLGMALSLDLSDTVTASDALTPVVALGLDLADTVGVGDFLDTLAWDHVLAAADSVATSESLQRDWDHALALVDTVTPSDLLTPSNGHALDLADVVGGISDNLILTSFTPKVIPGLCLWLDASVLTPGTSYASWQSVDGSGRTLSPIGSPAPVVTTPQAGQNGLPVMRYTNNGGHAMGSGAGFDLDYTMVAVARMTGGANQRFIGRSGGNFLVGWHGGDWDVAHLGGWLDGDGGPHPTGYTWKMYGLDAKASPYQPLLRSDGVVIRGTGGGATAGWADTFSLGGEASYSGQGSNGEIAEVVVYNRQLTDVERQQVEAYLRQKWITPGAALTQTMSDTVAPSDALEVGFNWAMSFGDTVTVTESVGVEVSLSFADGVNVSDSLDALGAAVFIDVDEVVTVSDLFGTQIGEDILPCHPNPIVGTFKAGDAIVGTYWVCAKKGILGLGARAPVLEIHNLAASPAGLGLGSTPPFIAWQPPQIPGGGMFLGAYAPGFSLKLTPRTPGLGLYGRLPLNVGLEPEIYPAGFFLGGHVPKFAGREPPVASAGLGLGGIVPGFKFTNRLATPSAGLALGAGIPVSVEVILVLPMPPISVDLLPVPDNGGVLTAAAVATVDLVLSAPVAVALEDVECAPADLDELECV